ncbi:MAG: hypothetical protein GY757_58950 [bacterium]|nr:hypothetical protein [bacterium]
MVFSNRFFNITARTLFFLFLIQGFSFFGFHHALKPHPGNHKTIWDKTASMAVMPAAAQTGGTTRVDAGLVALYTFDEGSGDTAGDVSGAGLAPDFVGFTMPAWRVSAIEVCSIPETA